MKRFHYTMNQNGRQLVVQIRVAEDQSVLIESVTSDNETVEIENLFRDGDDDIYRKIIKDLGDHFPKTVVELEAVLPKEIVVDAAPPTSPPAWGEALIALLAPKRHVEAQLGDMQEVFERNKANYGEAVARRMYWRQVARSVGPLLGRLIIRAVIEYARSKIGL